MNEINDILSKEMVENHLEMIDRSKTFILILILI